MAWPPTPGLPLTDSQLTSAQEKHLQTNGFHCNRRLRENGVGPEYLCLGHAKIVDGKVQLNDTCGEPCTYVCKEAHALASSIETLNLHNRIIREVRG